MHFVYIIYTPKYDKYYIVESVNFEERLLQHNQVFNKSSSTKFTDDWKKSLVLKVESRQDALLVEGYLKSMKSKQYLKLISSDEEAFEKFKSNIYSKLGIKIVTN